MKLCALLNNAKEGRTSSTLDTQVYKCTKKPQVIACSGKGDQFGSLKENYSSQGSFVKLYFLAQIH